MAPAASLIPAVPPPAGATLAALRARIGALEGGGVGRWGSVALGAAEIDSALPWGGAACGALHEIGAADMSGAAIGFCVRLVARFAAAKRGAVLWCARNAALDAGLLYGPGLAAFGLDPARLVLVRARNDHAALWAMEEGLSCPALAIVVGEVAVITLAATRRLQLAAEASGVTAFVLRRDAAARASASAAVTRWRLAAVPGAETNLPGVGASRWQAEMFRCRGGRARSWIVESCDETSDFAVAAPVLDRPAVPPRARARG